MRLSMYATRQYKPSISRVIQSQKSIDRNFSYIRGVRKIDSVETPQKDLVQRFTSLKEFQSTHPLKVKIMIISLKVGELERDAIAHKGFEDFQTRINNLKALKNLLQESLLTEDITLVQEELEHSENLLKLNESNILISDFDNHSVDFEKEVDSYKTCQGRDFSQEINKKKELKRILNIQLHNPSVKKNLRTENVHISIVPNDKYMTDLPEFQSLIGSRTPDGRDWKYVRGNGGTTIGARHYVAVTEENLLGTAPNLRNEDGSQMTGYEKGYSTTTHEIAHSIHRYGLSLKDKETITSCFNTRKKEIGEKKVSTENDWVDGRYFANPRMANTNNEGTIRALNKKTCYASRNEDEYFAQLTNAYLDTNMGKDPYTGCTRNNGKDWIKKEELSMYKLLKTLY